MGEITNQFHSLFAKNSVPVITQAEVTECGLACIAMVAGYYGLEIDLATLRRKYVTSLRGITLRNMINIAEAMDFEATPLRLELDDLRVLSDPVILHWNRNHFVVLTQVRRKRGTFTYTIIDPGMGQREVHEAELSKSFTGVVLDLVPGEGFSKRRLRRRLRLWQLWDRSTGLLPSISIVLGYSVIYQATVLLAPAFARIAIDEIVPARDIEQLTTYALAFVGLAMFGTAAAWFRARVLVHTSQLLSHQLMSSLARRLFRIPLGWYERRYIGDVISRFSSTQPITELLTRSLASGLLDTVVSCLTLTMMFVYSASLATVTLLAVIAHAIIRLSAVKSVNRLNAEAIVAQAAESTTLIESLNGIANIKVFGQERERFRIWQKYRTRATNALIRGGRRKAMSDVLGQGAFDLEFVLFTVIAVNLLIADRISVGTLLALISYRGFLVISARQIVQTYVDYQLLDVHLDRLADIVLAPVEESSNLQDVDPVHFRELNVKQLAYAYSDGEPEVLSGINLRVVQGESVAITGPSGAGKTTLAKLLVGLLKPAAGEIIFNGKPLSDQNIREWRSVIGYVSQEDVLYTGSLADNIAFFDPDMDLERVHEAAITAQIYDDIVRMPMKFDTLMGDMGTTLSGGQKARVLLARALYKQPQVLIADEGTAHLDMETERSLNEALISLKITRIIIAHRRETIESCSRIVAIDGGVLREVTSLG